MGKSSHKSRKRRRSSSRDRLSGIEEKLALLIDVLSNKEVRAPRALSHSPSSVPADQNDLASGSGHCSEDFSNDEAPDTILRSNGGTLAMPARQERPSAPHVSGVYEYPGPVTQAAESTQPFPILEITSCPFVVLDKNPSEEALFSSPSRDIQETIDNPEASEEADTLSKELFGADMESSEAIVWNDLVSRRWRDLVRGGLSEDQHSILIKKYSPSNEMDFLKAPRLNAECRSALKNNSVLKRDDHSCANQDQVGVALYALGETISDFLKPETQVSLSPEARLAVAKVNDGAKILADLFYRLSLSRKAQIKPTFNVLAKTTAEAIPADNLLFGSSFGEEIKKATTMEKSSKDITRATVTMFKKVQQPMKQQMTPAKSGNFRAPAPRKPYNRPAIRRSGPSSSNRRSPSHSRSRSKRR